MVEQILDGRQRGSNAQIVRDPAVLIERHVKVTTNQHPLVRNIHIFNSLFGHRKTLLA